MLKIEDQDDDLFNVQCSRPCLNLADVNLSDKDTKIPYFKLAMPVARSSGQFVLLMKDKITPVVAMFGALIYKPCHSRSFEDGLLYKMVR